MKIDLVFFDWIGKDMKSVYNIPKGIHLSTGDFHSGSTFAGQILFDSEQEAELLKALDEGYRPVFWISRGKYTPNLFKSGNWVNMKSGLCESKNFYIKYLDEKRVVVGHPNWISSDNMSYSYEEFMTYNPILLGPTKKKWWWRFLPPKLKEIICPYVPIK